MFFCTVLLEEYLTSQRFTSFMKHNATFTNTAHKCSLAQISHKIATYWIVHSLVCAVIFYVHLILINASLFSPFNSLSVAPLHVWINKCKTQTFK